jgi:hypothetical protein
MPRRWRNTRSAGSRSQPSAGEINAVREHELEKAGSPAVERGHSAASNRRSDVPGDDAHRQRFGVRHCRYVPGPSLAADRSRQLARSDGRTVAWPVRQRAELEPDVSFARGVGGFARPRRNSEGLGRRAIEWGRHSARFAATPSVRWRLRDLATAAIVEKGPKLLTPVGPGLDRIARVASCHALVASAPRTRDEAD